VKENLGQVYRRQVERLQDALNEPEILIAGLYSRIRSDVAELRSDVAELKQGRTTSAQENSGTRTAVGKDIANAKAGLAQAISEMREEVAKANAKLDALIESSRKPPSEKPRR
jgi:hypothetical protein